MDLIRRLQRLVNPPDSWEESRIGDWVYAIEKLAPHLNVALGQVKAEIASGREDSETRRRFRDALVAIRDWSTANGYGDAARQTYDLLINGLEERAANESQEG